jgi:transcriptional regulator with XRE-family HTH domain
MAKRPREKTAEILGANVRYLREHASISQVELARRMTERGWPWHQSTVYRVETGKQPVRFDEALDLADLLGVTLDRLTWAIGEAAEEEVARHAIDGLRERMQQAAMAITWLRIAQSAAKSRAAIASNSDYPHIRELADDIQRDLQSVNLDAVLRIANILWRRYKQLGLDSNQGESVSSWDEIWDDLHASTSLRDALERIDESYGTSDEDPDDLVDAFDPDNHDSP